MIAATYNIVCDQGATFDRTLTWKDNNGNPVDLTGYTARMQVRSVVDSSVVLLSLTTANSRIVLGGVAGTVQLTVDPTVMAAVAGGQYVYDLELVSAGGSVSRLVMGTFTVRDEVTR